MGLEVLAGFSFLVLLVLIIKDIKEFKSNTGTSSVSTPSPPKSKTGTSSPPVWIDSDSGSFNDCGGDSGGE